MALAPAFVFRSGSLPSTPRGKIASSRTLVSGSLARSFSTIAVMPAAICSEVLVRELFVPIITTATFGVMPLMLPLSNRQRTCSVRSPPMPAFIAFRGVKYFSQTFAPFPSQPCVIESPRKITSTSPAAARPLITSCRSVHRFCGRGAGVTDSFGPAGGGSGRFWAAGFFAAAGAA